MKRTSASLNPDGVLFCIVCFRHALKDYGNRREALLQLRREDGCRWDFDHMIWQDFPLPPGLADGPDAELLRFGEIDRAITEAMRDGYNPEGLEPF